MTWAYVLAVVGGAIVGLLYVRRRRPKPRIVRVEYWVYIPGDELPSQDAAMGLLFAHGRYSGASRKLGRADGILLSDIRLHVGLVLRSKNPHVFRPDLFSECAEPSQNVLTGLAAAKSLVKVRFISEQPVEGDSHLALVPHLAEAYRELARGSVVYDPVAERLTSGSAFAQAVGLDDDPTPAFRNVQSYWKPEAGGSGVAGTRGLAKIGLPELVTLPVPSDHETLVHEVVTEAAAMLWNLRELPESLKVRCFDDEFELTFQVAKDGTAQTRIHRVGGDD